MSNSTGPAAGHGWRIAAAAVLAATLVAALLTITRTTSQPRSAGHAIQVVAGTNVWGNIASQVGGSHVRVTSVLSDPGVDPHLYSSDARTAAAVSKADLVIANGLGYDDFLDRLLAASPNSHRREISVAKVLKPSGHDPNPHLWYDVGRVPEVARAIERALVAQDRANAAAYQSNLARFEQSLQPVLRLLNAVRAGYIGTPVAYTERVPGYLLAAAGLAVKTPAGFAQAIEEGNEPSNSDTLAMNTLITNRRVRVLLYNSQATSPVTQHVRDLAGRSGVPVVAVTETVPPGERTYQSWQLHQLQALQRALERP